MHRVKTLGTIVKPAHLGCVRLPPKVADAYYFTSQWKALRLECLTRDHFRCVLCGQPAIVADHIISRKDGGADALPNLRSLCRACDAGLRERPGASRAKEGRRGFNSPAIRPAATNSTGMQNFFLDGLNQRGLP